MALSCITNINLKKLKEKDRINLSLIFNPVLHNNLRTLNHKYADEIY